MPPFGFEGGPWLALTRGLAVASGMTVFGAIAFQAFICPAAARHMNAGQMDRLHADWLKLLKGCWLFSLFFGALWLTGQAGTIADSSSAAQALAALPSVVQDSRFGVVSLGRLGLLAIIPLVLGSGRVRWRQYTACLVAGLAVVSQVGFSHALSMADGFDVLSGSVALHVAAAGLWLGQLPTLWLFLHASDAKTARTVLVRFSPLGMVCVLVLLLTGSGQGIVLVGDLPRLVGTAYGWMILAKIILFLVLLTFAAANLFLFVPRLAAGSAVMARRDVARSVLVETLVGMVIVVAAGLLSSLAPAMHEQPLWLFSRRPSLVAMAEPELRDEVLRALMMIGAAMALVTATVILLRRWWWVATAFGVALVGAAVPHLDLLLVEAYPTSYFSSPTGFDAKGIVHGADLFRQHCLDCHGETGRGDGPKAKDLTVPPADLTAEHLWDHSDGELFWWLSHGIDSPNEGQAMPGFAGSLSGEERWQVIDYIRAHNAGLKMHTTGTWDRPISMPDFSVACPKNTVGGNSSETKGLKIVLGPSSEETVICGGATPKSALLPRDKPLLIAVGAAGGSGPAFPGMQVIELQRNMGADLRRSCMSNDPAAWNAFAVIAGLTPDDLDGTRILVDADGWLRALWKPGDKPDWNDPGAFSQVVRQVLGSPVASRRAAHHQH